MTKTPWARRWESFWQKVDFNGPMPKDVRLGCCWLWRGSVNPRTGYGSVNSGRHALPMTAHRRAWLLAERLIPPGHEICHKCDVRRCVRLSHLFAGTRSDNMRDASQKGRVRNQHTGKLLSVLGA